MDSLPCVHLRNFYFLLYILKMYKTESPWCYINGSTSTIIVPTSSTFPFSIFLSWERKIQSYKKRVSFSYLNNRVFLSRNYGLIVAPRKFDVLKTNICPRSEASRANMLVLRTSNFQGATIRPIVPRHKHSIVFIVHY